MDNQTAVREGHRTTDLQQQVELLSHRQATLARVHVDRLAFDVLQRQERPTVLIDPGVVQPGDVRVLQRGENVALTRHALGQTTCPNQPRQL